MAKRTPKAAKMPKIKRRLTSSEEFDVMKLVLDKFLWIGTALMGYGLFQTITSDDASAGLYFILTGAVVLVLFSVIIIREFEHLR